MLHIILGILKFIGIIVAAILLLVAAVILSVVFVPVRYHGTAKKTPEHTEGEIRLSWLLHMVTFYLTINLEQKKPVWILRIFGMTLEELLDIVKKPGKMMKSWKNRKRTAKKRSDDHSAGTDTSYRNKVNSADKTQREQSDDNTVKDTAVKDTAEDILTKTTESEDVETVLEAEDNSVSEHSTEDMESERIEESEESEQSGHSDKGIKDIVSRVREVLQKIVSLISAIPDKVCNFKNSAQKKKEDTEEKIRSISEKIQYYLGLGEKYEIKVLFGDVCTELFRMLSHYGPRKITGYIHFGTGDPALTGELTGLIYLLLPGEAGKFEVNPEFTEKVFETELFIHGKIRACHLLWLAWKLFRNKKLMRLIKEVRKSRRS